MNLIVSSNTTWYLYNFRRGLISRLVSEGHNVTVLAPLDNWTSRIEQLGCKSVHLTITSRSRNLFKEVSLVFRYGYYLIKERPDAYLGFTLKPVIYGGMVARLLGIPSIMTITGMGSAVVENSWTTRVVELLYRMSIRHAKKVVFQNHSDLQWFLDRKLLSFDRAIQVPGSGVNLSFFSAREPKKRETTEGVVFLMTARVLKDKGIFEFVEAAKQIKAKYPQTRFVLAGATDVDNPTAISRHEVERWVSDKLIEYVGNVDDVRPLLDYTDCVVLPSYREGLSRSLLEAAATARPAVTTSVPGCVDVVEDGITGLVCRPRDADDLSKKIEEFLDLRMSDRVEMGQQARQKIVREFDEKRVITMYANLLGTLAS